MAKKSKVVEVEETTISSPEDVELPELEGAEDEAPVKAQDEDKPRKQDDGPDTTEAPVDREPGSDDEPEPQEHEKEALPLHELGSWNDQDRAELSKAPRRVQEVVLKREREMFEGLKQYREKAQAADTVAGIIQPYLPVIRSEGRSVEDTLQSLFQTYYEIRQDPYGTMQRLAQATGVDLTRLVQLAQPNAPAQDPMMQQVMQRLNGLQQTVQQSQQQREEQERMRAQQELAQFAADPKNEFFSDPEVKATMSRSLQTGYARDIRHAYELACYDIPRIRAMADQRRQRDAEAKRALEAKTKAKTAKFAAQDVDVFGESSTPQTSELDTREALSRVWDKMAAGGRL